MKGVEILCGKESTMKQEAVETGWKVLSHPKLSITLQYPDPTPQGHSVSINERLGIGSFRIHLTSDDSDEVYFEIGQYFNLPRQSAVETFLNEITVGGAGIKIGETVEIQFASTVACQFSVQWPEKTRLILFIEQGETLYRIIYNPASPINKKVLETLKFNRP